MVAGEDDSPEAIAAVLKVSTEEVQEAIRFSQPIASLHAKIGEDGTELGDLFEDDGAINPAEEVPLTLMQRLLNQILEDGVPRERDRKIIDMRYGLTDGQPMSLEAIGKVVGINRESTRKVVVKYVGTEAHPGELRKLAQERDLRAFLD